MIKVYLGLLFVLNLIMMTHYQKIAINSVGGGFMAFINKDKKEIHIAPTDYVTVTRMNHILEFQFLEKKNTKGSQITHINEFEYCINNTGEIKKYNKSENKSQNLNSLRKTFKRLRYLINNNFVGNYNELFVTLTYRENMTDPKRLYNDFRKFIQRLRYNYSELGNVEYLGVAEPQGRGAFHMHVLFKFTEQKSVFIPNKDLADIWGYGFVKINRVDNIDNIGAYLTAYLTDIPLSESSEIITGEIEEKEINGEHKKILKGGRLHLYPSNMNLYRQSRGITYPKRFDIPYEEALKMIGNSKPSMESNIFIEDGDFENSIRFEQYNLKRGADDIE